MGLDWPELVEPGTSLFAQHIQDGAVLIPGRCHSLEHLFENPHGQGFIGPLWEPCADRMRRSSEPDEPAHGSGTD